MVYVNEIVWNTKVTSSKGGGSVEVAGMMVSGMAYFCEESLLNVHGVELLGLAVARGFGRKT